MGRRKRSRVRRPLRRLRARKGRQGLPRARRCGSKLGESFSAEERAQTLPAHAQPVVSLMTSPGPEFASPRTPPAVKLVPRTPPAWLGRARQQWSLSAASQRAPVFSRETFVDCRMTRCSHTAVRASRLHKPLGVSHCAQHKLAEEPRHSWAHPPHELTA
eukprot:Amastigsp_a686828_5.p3 type:complete len:160 gc:universal Amastigsp_a686828_5:787-308(-)